MACRVHATFSVAHGTFSVVHAAFGLSQAQKIGPRRARSLPHSPAGAGSPVRRNRGYAALPALASGSLAARKRLAVDLALKRMDSPARNVLRPWLLPETFSRP